MIRGASSFLFQAIFNKNLNLKNIFSFRFCTRVFRRKKKTIAISSACFQKTEFCQSHFYCGAPEGAVVGGGSGGGAAANQTVRSVHILNLRALRFSPLAFRPNNFCTSAKSPTCVIHKYSCLFWFTVGDPWQKLSSKPNIFVHFIPGNRHGRDWKHRRSWSQKLLYQFLLPGSQSRKISYQFFENFTFRGQECRDRWVNTIQCKLLMVTFWEISKIISFNV